LVVFDELTNKFDFQPDEAIHRNVLNHLGSDPDDELRNTTIPPSWQG